MYLSGPMILILYQEKSIPGIFDTLCDYRVYTCMSVRTRSVSSLACTVQLVRSEDTEPAFGRVR